MKYWMAVFGFLGFLGFGPNAGLAASLTGNKLLELCTASNDWDVGWCRGYLFGYLEGHDTALVAAVLQQAGGNSKSTAGLSFLCVPKGVTAGQMRDIVVAHLQENPDIRHWSAQWLVHRALMEAFPCKE